MHHQIFLALAAAYAISALPLNINLGAYSPALVVGDGEISFGAGPQGASEVLQTLASGAQNGAVGAGTAPRPGTAGAATINPAFPQSAQSASLTPGQTHGVSSPIVGGAGGAVGNRPETDAQPAAIVTPAEFISHALEQKYPNMAKKNKRNGVGSPAETLTTRSRNMRIKRDIDGFRDALNFARDALRNQPKVELGTEKAGVGILVNAGKDVPVNSAANGALPPGASRPEKRSVEDSDDRMGVTLIAIREI